MKKIKDIQIPDRNPAIIVNFRLDKEKLLQFRAKLKKNKKRISDVFRAWVDEYLKGD